MRCFLFALLLKPETDRITTTPGVCPPLPEPCRSTKRSDAPPAAGGTPIFDLEARKRQGMQARTKKRILSQPVTA